MIIFGSSVAEVGINSKVIGEQTELTVFNCAIDGTRMNQNKALVDEFLEYSSNCKYVVIGLAFFSFSEENRLTEPTRFFAHLSNDNVYNALNTMDPGLISKMKYVPFYSFTQFDHTFYKNSVLGWIEHFSGTSVDTLNGFTPHYTEWNVNEVDSCNYYSQKIKVDASMIELFTDLISEIAQNGKKAILVNMPMQEEGQKLFSNYDTVAYIANDIIYKSNNGKTSGHYFLNYSQSEITLDKKNYYNHGHLNARGADSFSRLFVDDLTRLGIINDHH